MEIKSQAEALEALYRWIGSGNQWDDRPEVSREVKQEYLRLLSANVAAMMSALESRVYAAGAPSDAKIVAWSTELTHATIESLVAGEKDTKPAPESGEPVQ